MKISEKKVVLVVVWKIEWVCFPPFFLVCMLFLYTNFQGMLRYVVFTWYDCFEIGPVDLYFIFICSVSYTGTPLKRVDPIFRSTPKNPIPLGVLAWKVGIEHVVPQLIAMWWQLKYILCSPLFGEDEPIFTHIFQMGWLKPPTRLRRNISQFYRFHVKFSLSLTHPPGSLTHPPGSLTYQAWFR